MTGNSDSTKQVSESKAVIYVVGSASVFFFWILLVANYLNASHIPFGIYGISAMLCIIFGRNYKWPPGVRLIARSILFTATGLFFAIIGAGHLTLYTNDPLGTALSLLFTGIAITSTFFFVEGIGMLKAVSTQRS